MSFLVRKLKSRARAAIAAPRETPEPNAPRSAVAPVPESAR
jgi:hypothetical protein